MDDRVDLANKHKYLLISAQFTITHYNCTGNTILHTASHKNCMKYAPKGFNTTVPVGGLSSVTGIKER